MAGAGGWTPEDYLESAVRTVLTGTDPALDEQLGHAALLLAGSGEQQAADRLIDCWLARTERPVTALVTGPLRARAWAMLFARRATRPDWAASLPPLDLDAEEAAHRAYLARPEPALPGLLGDSTAGRIVAELAEQVAGEGTPDPLRSAAAEVETLAAQGKDPTGALAEWTSLAIAGQRPDLALLAAGRHTAGLLAAGADPLGLGTERAGACAGDLIAALHTRLPAPPPPEDWPGLIHRILRLRGDRTEAPSPATDAALDSAERRLGGPLPADYRGFLRTCDGLDGTEVFPRLLGVAELLAEPDGSIRLTPAADTEHRVTLLPDGRVHEWDSLFGGTVHSGLRALLAGHLRLLEQAG